METAPTDYLPLAKALLLFAMVAWFAGTFHIVRLFVAHRSCMAKWEPDRTIILDIFKGMEQRALYYLIWPAMTAIAALGAWALWMHPAYFRVPQVQVFLGFAAMQVVYHMMVHRTYRTFLRGETSSSGLLLSVFAQGPTLLLVLLVVLLMLRDQMNWLAGSIGLLVIGGIIVFTITSARKPDPQPQDAGDR